MPAPMLRVSLFAASALVIAATSLAAPGAPRALDAKARETVLDSLSAQVPDPPGRPRSSCILAGP